MQWPSEAKGKTAKLGFSKRRLRNRAKKKPKTFSDKRKQNLSSGDTLNEILKEVLRTESN